MPKHKNQHFVPRSYLEPWVHRTDQDNHKNLWIHTSDGTQMREVNPRNAFLREELYTLQRDDEERDLSLEHQLTRIEEHFGASKQKFLRRKTHSIEDAVNAAAFAAMQLLRTPHIGEFWRNYYGDQLKELEHRIARNAEVDCHNSESAPSAIQVGDAATREYKWTEDGLEELKEVVSDPLRETLAPGLRILANQIAQIPFTILTTESLEGFITSDSPTVFFDTNPESSAAFPFALGTSSSSLEITLPLSPSTLLLWSWKIRSPFVGTYVPIDRSTLLRFNRRTLKTAHAEVVTLLPAWNTQWLRP